MSRHLSSYVIPIMVLISLMLATTSVMPGSAQEVVEIIIGTTDMPVSIDPADAIDYPSWELLQHLYTGLTRQVPGTLSYELALATDHSTSDDGLTHMFTVAPDAAFSDGTTITAETFVTSINRVINLGRAGANFINRYVQGVSAGSDNTVIFTLLNPLPDFEALVALPPFLPQHPDIYPPTGLLSIETMDRLISNGVYQLDSFTDGEIILTANPDYTGPPAANDRIIIRGFTLPIDLRRAILNQEIDIAWRALAQPDLDALQNMPSLIVEEQANLQAFYLLLNHNQISLNNQDSFDDPAVRHGFALLVDRERSARLGFDETVTPLYTILPDVFDIPPATYPAFDPQAADQVLNDAGYRPRRTPIDTQILISSDTYGDLMGSAAQEIRRSIEQSDIVDITGIQNSETETFISAVNRGEYLSAIIGWRPPYASPAGYLVPLAHSESFIPQNAGVGSERIDELMVAASLSTDTATKRALYSEIQNELLDGYDLIPLWQGQDVIVYQNDVSGILVETNSWLHYDRLYR